MERTEIYERLQTVFCDVFDCEEIALSDATTAADVEGWDSLSHITLIAAIEDEFEISIPMKAVVHLENVGQLVSLIAERAK